MAITTKPLTDTQIRTAKPKDKVYALNDGHGLQLRIKPTGVKVWIFGYYRPFIKQRTTITFGGYPALSLADARTKRDEARSLLAQNKDPKKQREELPRENAAANANTLQHVAANWLEVKRANVTQAHADDNT